MKNNEEHQGFYVPDDWASDTYKHFFNKEDMKKYSKEVLLLLQEFYKNTGGVPRIKTEEELVCVGEFWKLIVREGNVTAVCIYKMHSDGHKVIYATTDNTMEGKKDLLSIMTEGVTRVARGAYCEVSGAPKSILIKLGLPTVPNSKVAKILNKNVTPLEDGYHYTRTIAGKSV